MRLGGSTPTVVKTPPAQANAPETSVSWRAMTIVTLLFFMWGLLTSLNDILVPHLKAIFELKYVEVMLIQFSFFSAYFIFAMPAGRLIEWVGYKHTIVLGLVTMGAGGLLFIPAASVPSCSQAFLRSPSMAWGR
jgi:MFS transporter, FHS family, L-fucose permease